MAPIDLTSDTLGIQTLNLVIAAFLGGLIGLERGMGRRPAGLRTNMLVAVGSALFTMLSLHAFPGIGDKGRIAAQIVSGIGFLGAGTLWRSQDATKGLTTAAGMWTVAAIGMAVGAGLGLLALSATIIVLIILTVMMRFEREVMRIANAHSNRPEAGGEG